MNNTAQMLKKLQDLFTREIEKLSPHIIVPTDSGVRAFGRYTIQLEHGWYKVNKLTGSTRTFGVQSHAMAWCIADKFGQVDIRRKIECLSERFTKLSMDLVSFKFKYRGLRDHEDRAILAAKMSQSVYELNKVTDQLEKCISQAKYWQQQEFHHEIERSQAPNSPAASSSSHGELFGAWSRIQ